MTKNQQPFEKDPFIRWITHCKYTVNEIEFHNDGIVFYFSKTIKTYGSSTKTTLKIKTWFKGLSKDSTSEIMIMVI